MRSSISMLLLLPFLLAADFSKVDPNAIPKDDPRAKELPRMLSNDARRRMQAANERESKAFAAVTTKAEWEAFSRTRIAALRESLGTFPEPSKEMRVRRTGTIEGDGFRIHNLVYETRPGFWATANLYLPIDPSKKMPGIIISHAHHTPKEQGELQDMGMTWARAGCAVLVPDHLGHGERRQHDFRTDKDYPKPFRASRQDYYFRYNTALQLELVGESLMGWMVWDLMRGVDVLLTQPTIDKDRILLLGAVAGGGDPAGVTAALDQRITAVAPFNFGGVQPDYTTPANTDRDFYWFSEGYWETTRCLKNGARDGFAHYAIVGSVAPRKVIYAHEFDWIEKSDPAWPRLAKVFDFYSAKDSLRIAHGTGSLKGNSPNDSHCTHIGPIHRKGIHAAFAEWFQMPVPAEYSKRRSAADLRCWTDEARAELKPKPLHEVLGERYDRIVQVQQKTLDDAKQVELLRKSLAKSLGRIEPVAIRRAEFGEPEAVPGGTLRRVVLEVEPGIVVPYLLITPLKREENGPVVVMIAQAGKAAFMKHREEAITAFLSAGVAVCLVDVRGTGETKLSDGSASRGSSRTSISQGEWILGQTVLGAQLRDLRTVLDHLNRDGARVAVWGDSFAEANRPDRNLAVPQDAPDSPAIAEPAAALLAILAGLFDSNVKAIYAAGGLPSYRSAFASSYFYLPHDAIVPIAFGDIDRLIALQTPKPIRLEGLVTAGNVLLAEAEFAAAFARTRDAYRRHDAAKAFVVGDRRSKGAAEWIARELTKQ